MNKKIVVGITIAVIIVAVTVVGLKAIMGDKATELPAEEHVEKTLNVQETNKSSSNLNQTSMPSSSESSESGP